MYSVSSEAETVGETLPLDSFMASRPATQVGMPQDSGLPQPDKDASTQLVHPALHSWERQVTIRTLPD